MKLFTIGDSISQGLMSLGVARTDLSYSTWIARALGIDVGDGFSNAVYRVPEYPANGMLLDIEAVLRHLQIVFGRDIEGIEWARFAFEMNKVLEASEEYYERGEGSRPYRNGDVPWFHNVAVFGCDVADAWLVNGAVCKERIAAAPGKGDGFLSTPNASFYRTALRVLNPSMRPELDGYTQLDWLSHHAQGEGIENVLLWLGPNNAVGSAILLAIHHTDDDPERRPVNLTLAQRTQEKWNLWLPGDFAAEYGELLDRVDAILRKNACPGWRVFLGNIPHVTICPLAAGVGAPLPGDKPLYFANYTYPPLAVNNRFVDAGGPHLTEMQARFIDTVIDECNRKLVELVEAKNATHAEPRYHVVDVCGGLDRLAYRRNGGEPTYELPAGLRDSSVGPIDTRFYDVEPDGRRVAGGVVSLDGVHPTAIGQGLLAHEFLKVMKEAGIAGADPRRLPWPAIVASDSLYQRPIPLIREIYQHNELAMIGIKAYRFVYGSFEGRRSSIKDF